MKSLVHVVAIMLLMAFLHGMSGSAWAAKADDSDALAGVTQTKSLFDIGVSEPKTLEFYLRVIRQTYDDLVRQGQKPDMIIDFRGSSVRLVTTETWSFSEEDQALLTKAAQLVKELKGLGVRMEACSIATDFYKIDPATILPEIKMVGNTFITLTGYQSKGYSLVPIQ